MNIMKKSFDEITMSRRAWVFADAHIGHVSDERDGGEWFEMAVDDVVKNGGDVDYVMNLGDISHRSLEEQFQKYVAIREQSGINKWYEMPGNHDVKAVTAGVYQRYVGSPRYWSLVDGNMAFFSLPAERGNAAGIFVPEVDEWLRAQIDLHKGKNIIICAHQFPYDTVDRSTRGPRYLYPPEVVEQFLKDVHIDLWLGAHIHSGRRNPDSSIYKNNVMFINVASVSHTYGTEACNSFFLDMKDGEKTLDALCREHDTATFLEDQNVEVELSYPIELAEHIPVFTEFDLDIPDRYREIQVENVTEDMLRESS
ncbi:MAG: metallophosphoesterase [Kiritimatiellae bacterium]|nr:metallophosphoesterase [Kiritimatiellia bacterium]